MIEEEAFRECAILAELTIPAGLMRVERNAFADCPELFRVTYQAPPTALLQIAGGNSDFQNALRE